MSWLEESVAKEGGGGGALTLARVHVTANKPQH